MRTAGALLAPSVRPPSHPSTAAAAAFMTVVAENEDYLPLGAMQDSDRQSVRPRPRDPVRSPDGKGGRRAAHAHPFYRAAV